MDSRKVMTWYTRRAQVPSRGRGAARRGFTLVELLVTMLIIAILASLLLGALSEADESARMAKTQALVEKLNNIVMARWDGYRTVRLPIAADAKSIGGVNTLYDSANDINRFRQNVARRRMFALREMVRLEMPDRYDDLDPGVFNQCFLVRPEGQGTYPVRTAIWHAYQRRLNSAKASRKQFQQMSMSDFINHAAQTYESAECLYLIVTTNVDSSDVSISHIAPTDWGDKDNDGMPEFWDAWGNPIEFLRWAPGVESPLQPVYRYPTNVDSDKRWRIFHQQHTRDPDDPSMIVSRWNINVDKVVDNSATNVTVSGATRTLIERTVVVPQEDPFNPMRVGSAPDPASQGTGWTRSMRWRPGDPPPENGYALYPFIFSWGPDQESGIQMCLRRDGWAYDSSPSDGFPGPTSDIRLSDPYAVYKLGNEKFYRGAPTGNGTHYDNITNHQIGTR